MALLIKSTGDVQNISPQSGKEFSLEEMQSAVGGYIEILDIGHAKDHFFMIVNEEGKLRNLPINMTATALAKIDLIVGDVLVVNEIEVGK